ncbi:MAG TPA: biotin/lipoyl-binding protein, partial [Gemmatimonadales bacterium]|nr:biotin/lipoyl-binding protein [Gemmatimonadales bacterium]
MMDSTDGQTAGRRSRIRLIIALLAVVFVAAWATRGFGLLGGGAAGGPQMGGGDMPPMPVDVDTARRDTVVDALRATGRIEAIQAVELRPDEQGRITDLLFREGQAVEAGTPLVQVDDALLRAQAERAAADR